MTTSTGFRGADTSELDRLASAFTTSAGTIEQLAKRAADWAHALQWYGSDCGAFQIAFQRTVAELNSVVSGLLTAAQHVQRQALQQELVSSLEGSLASEMLRLVMPADAGGGYSAADLPIGSPRAIRAWWSSLSPFEQQQWVLNNPALIGSTDGIPVKVRHEANMTVLAQQKQTLQAELVVMRGKWGWFAGSPLSRWFGEPRAIAKKLEGIEAIEQALAAPGENYLMKFDARDDGQFIAALGNPETATNTTIYVPGMGSDLRGAGGILDAAGNVQESLVRHAGPGESAATIAYLGYDAPDFGTEVLSRSYAEQAAVPLDRFVDGVRAGQEAAGAQITMLGHSYGSTTVGNADRTQQLDADRFIAIGSVGTTADHVSELSFGAENVWSITANNDIALSSPSPQERVQLVAGLGAALTGNYPVAAISLGTALNPNDPHLMHGRNPSHPTFGANVVPLRAANGDTSGYQPATPFGAHVMYTQRGEPTLEDIGSISMGDRDH